MSISIALGRQLAAGRRRLALTQRALAARTGISQSAYSRIERGLGARAPLETWVALGIAVDRPLAVTFTRPLGEGVGLGATADAGHLEIEEHLLTLARAADRHGTFELPTQADRPRALDRRRHPRPDDQDADPG